MTLSNGKIINTKGSVHASVEERSISGDGVMASVSSNFEQYAIILIMYMPTKLRIVVGEQIVRRRGVSIYLPFVI